MGERIAVVTGASSGIGRASALALARAGFHLVLVVRDGARGDPVRKAIEAEGGAAELVVADLALLAGVRGAAGEITARHSAVHLLVNNAGGVFFRRETTAEGTERTFALNVLSPFLLTRLLEPVLRAAGGGARVVWVSSEAHRGSHVHLNDLETREWYRGFRAYTRSKLALLLVARSFAQRGPANEVLHLAVHPGFVRSRFGQEQGGAVAVGMRFAEIFGVSPEKAARTVVYAATSPELAGSPARTSRASASRRRPRRPAMRPSGNVSGWSWRDALGFRRRAREPSASASRRRHRQRRGRGRAASECGLEDHGEVLLGVASPDRLVDHPANFAGEASRRRRGPGAGLDEPEVLAREGEKELRLVPPLEQLSPLALEHHGAAPAASEELEHARPVEAHPLAKRERFGEERNVADREQVVDELHRRSLAHGAKVVELVAEVAQERPGALDVSGVAPDIEDQAPRLGGVDAPPYRGVDEVDPLGREPFREAAALVGADRAEVDHQAAGPEPPDEAGTPEDHRVERARVTQHREDDPLPHGRADLPGGVAPIGHRRRSRGRTSPRTDS